MADFQPGQQVKWYPQIRGGYGFFGWVPASVVKASASRVQIAALKRDGSTVLRWVKPSNLQPR